MTGTEACRWKLTKLYDMINPYGCRQQGRTWSGTGKVLGKQMGTVAILTDSNSGISQEEAKKYGVYVLPMPFYINDELFYEGITLSQDQFYRYLENDSEIHTSMPLVGSVLDKWDELLKDYGQVVYIPMSGGLSSSCQTARSLAADYDGRVEVVDNHRISVTMMRSVLNAKGLADLGWDAKAIREYLEKTAADSSIYILVPTLKYLKKGGRLTPAAALLGSLLKIKPVLQIQGEKLDSYAKCRTLKAAKAAMLGAIEHDIETRFRTEGGLEDLWIDAAYSGMMRDEVTEWIKDIHAQYPVGICMQQLALSISCHVGPGCLAVTAEKKLPEVPIHPVELV